LGFITTLGKAKSVENVKIEEDKKNKIMTKIIKELKKSNSDFLKAAFVLITALILATSVGAHKRIKRLEHQLKDTQENGTFYRECLLSDELSDPCRSWIMLERFGVTIGETYIQAE